MAAFEGPGKGEGGGLQSSMEIVSFLDIFNSHKFVQFWWILRQVFVLSVKVINSLEIVSTLKFARLTYLPAAANIVEQLLQSFANSFPRKLITAQI